MTRVCDLPRQRRISRVATAMDGLPDATQEDEEVFPRILCSFHKWMLSDPTRKNNTAKSYVRQLVALFEDDGKSPASMASDQYYQVTKSSFKNKCGNGQRSSAIRLFRQFWALQSEGPWEDDENNQLYRSKTARRTKPSVADSLTNKDEESPEEKQLRKDFDLPVEGWKVVITFRASGTLKGAVSPGGSSYGTREAVDKRLGRLNDGCEKESKKPRKALEASPGSGESASQLVDEVVNGQSPTPVEVEGQQPLQQEAVRICGRNPDKRLAQRINGLYHRIEPSNDGRPVYRKSSESKQTLLFFSAARGCWRIANDLTATGEFARNKDTSAERPWKIQKPWKVFMGTDFEEDPELAVFLAGPEQAQAVGAETTAEGSLPQGRRPQAAADGSNDGTAGGSSPSQQNRIEDDVPQDHPAHSAVNFCAVHRRFQFRTKEKDTGNSICVQTTVKAAHGSKRHAARICRLLYAKSLAGATKDELVEYRAMLYQRLEGLVVSDNSGDETDVPPSQAVKDGAAKKNKKEKKDKKDKKNKKDKRSRDESDTLDASEPKSKVKRESVESNGDQGVKKEESDIKEEHKKEIKEEEEKTLQTLITHPKAKGKSKGKGKGKAKAKAKSERSGTESSDSESDSSDDSESSSSDESDSESGEKQNNSKSKAAEAGAMPAKPVLRPGRVAAKMSVRTGLRCYCHYARPCPDKKT